MKQKKSHLIFFSLLFSLSFSNVYAADIENALESNLIIMTDNSIGTGIAIEKNRVLTAAHVVGDNETVNLVIEKKNSNESIEIEGKVLSIDAEKDLALIYSPLDLKFIDKSESELRIGQTVLAIGAPNSYIQVTRGVISAFFQEDGLKYIQTDAAINPGNSGGALISEEGSLIGIVVSRSKSQEGIGFAVAIESIERWLVVANEVPIPETQANEVEVSNQSQETVLRNETLSLYSQASFLIFPILVIVLILAFNAKNRAKRKRKGRHFNVTFNE
jgi:S1-C subfamily serine protease